MAFKGTERRSALAIAREIEAVGGQVNAYTSREQTAYYAKVLAEDVPLAVDILADILQHSVFEPVEFERERQVILQEIGQAEDTPDDIVFDYFQECAFPDQPMGRPVLGRAEIIRRLDRATVAGYMSRHYGASGMVLVAAGKVDHDTLVALAERAFTDLPVTAQMTAEPPRYKGGDLRRPRDLEQVHVLLGFPGVAFGDPDYYALSVLSVAFGGGMSSRLFQEIREKRGLVYSVYSFVQAYSDSGLFGIYAGTGEVEVAELIPALCEEVRRLPEGFDGEELHRARAQLKAGILMGLESTTTRAEQQAHHVLLHGTPLDPQEIVRCIEAVDAEAVARVASRLGAGPLTLTALGPIGRLEEYGRVTGRLAA
jgi:predicted Zn-dependent peptidase